MNIKICILVIVDNSKYVEIIIEKDIELFLFSETLTQRLEDTLITKIMKPIKFADNEITPKEAAEIMSQNSINSLTKYMVTKVLIIVKFDKELYVACETVLENNVNGLIVHDDDNDVLGIFSKTTVSKVLVSV
ncbi:MAG: CBS domain-containing protein [Nitrosopumilus sp.]|nr:CBS domain-containing protein [Nitrosopumilus sp.]MDH5554128.1 CBS domain-containing protein [Nitrosopumilus sp.]